MRLPVAAALLALLGGCVAPGASLDAASTGAPALSCAPCKALVDDTPFGGWEPHVAIDPLDPAHVVVASRAQGPGSLPFPYVLWFDVYVSRDGGATWSVTPLRYTEPFGSRGDPRAPNVVGDPVLAFLDDGTLLLTGATLQYLATPAGGALLNARLFVARSTDGGDTFEPPVVVVESEGVVVQAEAGPLPPLAAAALLRLADKPWLATGPDGLALLAWADILVFHPEHLAGARTDIVLSVSRDGGRTWGPRTPVASGSDLQGPSPVVLPDGAWAVAYVDLAARVARVAVSRDEGATWTDAAVAPSAWMPSLAASGDRLLLAAAAPLDAGGNDAARQAPTLSWSDDGGETWTAPLALGAPEAPGRALPSVAADADGVAYVSFAHARGDGTSAYRAVALRPGEAWRAELTLDDAIAGPTSRMGDYVGLAAGAAGAFAAWTTTEDGTEWDVAGAALRVGP